MDVSLSVLLHASALNLETELTDRIYSGEIKDAQIRGLSRIPRHTEKSNNEWLAMHQRLYGPLSQLAWTRKVIRPPNYLLAFAVLFVGIGILGYLYYSPEYWALIQANIQAIGAILFLIVALGLTFLLRRRRRRSL